MAGAKAAQRNRGNRRSGVNTFRKAGGHWTVQFGEDDEPLLLDDLDGMTYIHYLLSKPNKDVPTMELYRSRYPAVPDPTHMIEIGCDDDDEDTTSGDSPDPVADREYLQSCYVAMQELRGQIEQAQRDNDMASETAAQEKLDKLRTVVRQITRPDKAGGDRSRIFRQASERVANNVPKRIQAALNHIGKHHPLLHAHLNNAISTGFSCKYSPEKPLEWDL